MGKRLLFTILVIGLLVFTACDEVPTATPSSDVSDAEMATLIAIGTEAAVETEEIVPTETPQPVIEPTPTETEQPATITITSIVGTGPGKALVSWDAVGNFPEGFKVVWTDVQGLPTFPENTNVYVNDPYARSATISGETGKIYYVRVCRFLGGQCDSYSDLGIFAYQMAESTPKPTATEKVAPTATKKITPGSGGGTITPAIKIVLMKGGEDGKAYIKWESNYSPSKGFKICYSTTNKNPTFDTAPYFYVSDKTKREAWVDGVPGTTYYYRICGYDGSKCENYSDTYTYKFPGTPIAPTADAATLTIDTITDIAPGAVRVTWSGTGSFPNGYKVMWSDTNPNPTMADNYYYASSEATHTADITTLKPGQQYYFRVCKYYGGNCTVYSPTKTFTLAAAAAESGFTLSEVSNVAGNVQVSWVISPDSASGYKVMWSTTNPLPTMADSWAYVSSPTVYSYTDTASPAGPTYYRACRWSGSWCLSYSNAITVTITAP